MTAPRSLRERRVFVDSSAYLALLDATDEHHEQAQAIVGALADTHYRQFTTNVVVIEAHALILAELGIFRASQFLRGIDASHTVVVRVRQADEERAKQIIFRYADRDFSFTDALSFAIMERLGIRVAFAFDRHFAQYGFIVATPQAV
jgi:predicted nucleic acid-binding protein